MRAPSAHTNHTDDTGVLQGQLSAQQVDLTPLPRNQWIYPPGCVFKKSSDFKSVSLEKKQTHSCTLSEPPETFVELFN